MSRRRRLIRGGLGNTLGVGQGLQAWHDTTDASYLTLVSPAITQFLDRSGNSNHTNVQGTSTARPTFTATQLPSGLSAAVFDGGDVLTAASALHSIPNGDFTIFAVAKRATEDASAQAIFSMGVGGFLRSGVVYSATAGIVSAISNTTGSGFVNNTGNTNTDYQIITFRKSGTTQALSVNGGAEATNTSAADNASIDSFYIGGNAAGAGQLAGGVAILLAYNRSLSAAEITSINTYLANLTGITLA